MSNLIAILTAAFTAGILCAGYCSWLLPLLYISIIMIMLLMILQVYVHKYRIWCVAVLFFFIGMLRFIHDDALEPTDISHYAGQTMVVYGTINEIPKITPLDEGENKVNYLITLTGGHMPDGPRIPITGVMPVTVRQSNSILAARQGDEVRAAGEVILLHGYNNPAQYDSVAANQRKGIRARMFTKEQDMGLISVNSNVSWKHTLALWRQKMIENMQQVMPQHHASILAGMLFGGYGGIPREIIADFATTGIVHILSVSGSHIALVVGVITVLGTLAVRRFALHNTKAVPLIAACLVTLYAVLCGLTPPVIRSLIMGLIALAAICFGREKDAANALLISALGMLIQQPSLVYDLSFQLSFASTAGIVFLNKQTAGMLSALPIWMAKLMAVTIAAQLGVLPFIAWYFNSFSLSSLVANLIIVPLIEWIVILGLFGAIISLLAGIVGSVIMIICSLLISAVIQCTAWLAAVPGAKLYIPSIGLIGGMVYYILLAWVYGYKPQNVLSLTELTQKWPRQSAVFLVSMMSCFFVYSMYPRPVYIHFIDVGQGDAALIVTPRGRAILVDTGGVMNSGTDFDIGDRVILPYLRHYGVLSIDYLFLTHGHQDHAGGAAAVARELPVKNSMLSREAYTQAVHNLVGAAHNSVFIPVYEAQQINIDGVVIKVIHAAGGLNIRQNNEVSSVVQVKYGQHSFLLTGDLEKSGEEAILASGKNVSSTVLKVGHHGSKTSSTTSFLQAVAPEYAVISVGKNNRFNHPHSDVIKRLLAQKSKIYRTDQHGAVVFQTDGKELLVDTFIK
ncbi:MAG: DNA internalization-related competence protein ComEC/Rec2 [Sporomusaceae bacterium]|nr:DNA internalization-related competence protein ComEC/Rec2 [Sporomusaceae bacterium]